MKQWHYSSQLLAMRQPGAGWRVTGFSCLWTQGPKDQQVSLPTAVELQLDDL